MNFAGWENLIFLIPMLIAFVIGLGGVIGIIDFDVDADFDLEIDSPEIDDGELHEALEIKNSFLDLFGFGKVPLSIIATTAQMIFGTIGVCSNLVLQPILRVPLIYGLISLAVASVGMVFFTGVICRAIGRWMPATETYVRGANDLIGKDGTAYTAISTTFGVAQVRDANLTLHKIPCKTYEGNIDVGNKILVTEYDSEDNVYTVDKFPEV